MKDADKGLSLIIGDTNITDLRNADDTALMTDNTKV